MARFLPAPLYAIVDVMSGEAAEPLALGEKLAAAGVPWLQLRVKSTPSREHVAIAERLIGLARPHGTRVIVNDRLDVALASGAAGVHLGQDDLPLTAARFVANHPEFVIGISTHDVGQARAAEAGGADYIGFGPMFPTSSKANALPPRANGALGAVRAAVGLPIVAIGGITEATASGVLSAGANAVAMIGALASAPDPVGLATSLLQLNGYRS
ncbi:MAG: thiamine phosphate synthase [Candidatus Binatia bacterium]|nr:thiamine phosphate synthase [Candidatus Binatia bacterium]